MFTNVNSQNNWFRLFKFIKFYIQIKWCINIPIVKQWKKTFFNLKNHDNPRKNSFLINFITKKLLKFIFFVKKKPKNQLLSPFFNLFQHCRTPMTAISWSNSIYLLKNTRFLLLMTSYSKIFQLIHDVVIHIWLLTRQIYRARKKKQLNVRYFYRREKKTDYLSNEN